MFYEVFCQRFFVAGAQSSFFAVHVPSQADKMVNIRRAQPSRNVELLKALVDEQLDLDTLEHEVVAKTSSIHTTKTEVSP